jgi:TatD DNase family protein
LIELKRLMADRKVVAVGEIGLDYHWVKDDQARERERELLKNQLAIAEVSQLPVVLHMRETDNQEDGPCANDMLLILGEWVQRLRAEASPLAERPGVLHSFSGSLETARKVLELGFYIGVTGPISFPGAHTRRELARRAPAERLLIETDSPFLAPQPHRGKRNEPAFVTHIADRIAVETSRTYADVTRETSENANRLFRWGDPD